MARPRIALPPIAEWARGYDRQLLRADLLAGVTVAAFTVPEGMAYATLAGLPAQAGLYASLAGMAVYALVGTSRQLSIGPTSALAILTVGSLSAVASAGSPRYLGLAALTALLVGALAVAAALLRLGFLAQFFSRSMLVGFSIGAALYIGSTQLARLFGLPGVSGGFLENVGYLLTHLGETHGPSLAVGVVGLVALLVADRFLPRLPNPLILVLLAVWIASAADLAALGVKTVGAIPQGLPRLGIEDVFWTDLRVVLPLAIACFLTVLRGGDLRRAGLRRTGSR
jgi:SulP family sulfate permease